MTNSNNTSNVKKRSSSILQGILEASPAGQQPNIKPKTSAVVNQVKFTWDGRNWKDARGNVASGLMHDKLMQTQGLDRNGNPLRPGILQRAKDWASGKTAGAGQATRSDPTASLGKKLAGTLGAKIGSMFDRNKAPAPQAQPAQQAPAQAPASQAQSAQQAPASQVDQNLGNIVKQMRAYQPQQGAKILPTQMAQSVSNDLAKVRHNKDWAVMTGSKILKFANAGYDVADLHKKWSQEVAIGKKQKIMQDKFSEELEILKKLAGI